MAVLLLMLCIGCSFVLGRLTSFKQQAHIKTLTDELRRMTNSRDWWREKYVAKALREKLQDYDKQ